MKYHDSLFRILRAFAMYRPDIGYVQGMNLIGAFFLNCLRTQEHDAFIMMIYVMRSSQINHRKTFAQNFPQMHDELKVLINALKSR